MENVNGVLTDVVVGNDECCQASNGTDSLAAACTGSSTDPNAALAGAAFSLCDVYPADGRLSLAYELDTCYETVCSVVCPVEMESNALCACKSLDASALGSFFDLNNDDFIDLTEFTEIYSAAMTGNWPYAADLIWNNCNIDNSDTLESTEAFACYIEACQIYCSSHPDIACQCNDHTPEELMPIYDDNNDQRISRDEFDTLVYDAENNLVPWPTNDAVYNYSSNLGECFKIETVSGVTSESVVDNAECCQASNGND
jgi:hypothetical protein